MSCPSFDTLSAEVDQQLSQVEAEAVRAHVTGCDRCRVRRTDLLLLKARVRGATIVEPASDQLKARLAAAVRNRRRSRTGWLAAAVAAATVAVGALVFFVRAEDVVDRLVGDHIGSTVTGDEPLDVVSGDPSVLEAFFAGRVEFPLRVPRLPAARLVGARMCDVSGGRRVPLTAYDRDGRRISLFAIGKAANAGPEACREGVRGYTACRRTAAGIDYLLVSDYPSAETSRILTAALSQR